MFGFDDSEKNRDLGTRPFKLPVPRKIVPVNLYNPHEKKEEGKEVGSPGPGKYNLPSTFPLSSLADTDEPVDA